MSSDDLQTPLINEEPHSGARPCLHHPEVVAKEEEDNHMVLGKGKDHSLTGPKDEERGTSSHPNSSIPKEYHQKHPSGAPGWLSRLSLFQLGS